jgi:hypothetical protein
LADSLLSAGEALRLSGVRNGINTAFTCPEKTERLKEKKEKYRGYI